MASSADSVLQEISSEQDHEFSIPTKRINEGHDLPTFLTSTAYHDILTFLRQLNYSMFAEKKASNDDGTTVRTFDLDCSDPSTSSPVVQLQHLLHALDEMIGEVPPDTGPRRFGNVSFRNWCGLLEQRAPSLLDRHLPDSVRDFKHVGDVSARSELQAYFVGAFGSAQRLDYGTGHELSFLAFLGSIWKLGGFEVTESGKREREIVVGVIQPYLELVRKLIETYTLEPAGSHGVWGLDDHSFLPYIFGSAQLGPEIRPGDPMPVEGSRADAPKPSSVTDASTVAEQRTKNMYFSAIGFIYDVKKGPFWEHSRYLYDISGIEAGWGKINKGMLKMYNAEVLSKFPVVQHFPFGSLFRWERDPDAAEPLAQAHMSSQPQRPKPKNVEALASATPRAPPIAPLADHSPRGGQMSSAYREISRAGVPPPQPAQPGDAGAAFVPTRAPWAK